MFVHSPSSNIVLCYLLRITKKRKKERNSKMIKKKVSIINQYLKMTHAQGKGHQELQIKI